MTNSNRTPSERRNIHEDFEAFFEVPTKEQLQMLLKKNRGESNQVDYKRDWIEWPKLARHILAIANSLGGMIIIGVEQNKDTLELNAIGLNNPIDPVEIGKNLQKFIPSWLEFHTENYLYTKADYPKIGDKKFAVIFVEDRPQYTPYLPNKESGDELKFHIYVRRNTASVTADYNELQAILNRRIETEYSSKKEFNLEQELSELEALYRKIQPDYYVTNYEEHLADMIAFGDDEGRYYLNTFYPDESIDAFVASVIKAKKSRIRQLLRISPE